MRGTGTMAGVLGAVLLALGLASCSVFQAGGGDAGGGIDVAGAEAIGDDVGDIACSAVMLEYPAERPTVETVVTQGRALLETPDLQLAAINLLIEEAIGDPKARALVGLGVRRFVRRMQRAGVDVGAGVIAPDSPAAAGLGALFDACELALGAPA